MRRFLKACGYFLLSVFSAELLIGIIDGLEKWHWIKEEVKEHEKLAALLHSPLSYLILLIFGFACLFAERKLKQPKLEVHLKNARTTVNLSTAPIGALFETAEQGEVRKLDWHCFLEIQVANDADIPTTIDEIRVNAHIKRKWWTKREAISANHSLDLDDFTIDKGFDAALNPITYAGNQYEPVPSLMDKLHNVPLTRGIGHRGWIRIDLNQISLKDINNPKLAIDLYIIDALRNKHDLLHRKKDEKNWDKNFAIMKDAD